VGTFTFGAAALLLFLLQGSATNSQQHWKKVSKRVKINSIGTKQQQRICLTPARKLAQCCESNVGLQVGLVPRDVPLLGPLLGLLFPHAEGPASQ
jgi:hypothetical protein